MKKLAFATLLLASNAYADDECLHLGVYAFWLTGCPEAELGVNPSVPLCDQPQWAHLDYYDGRCFEEVSFDWKKECYTWDCPTPYEHTYRARVSGRIKTAPLDADEIDQHYRSVRQLLGQVAKRKQRS